MKNHNQKLQLSALSLAMRGALAAMVVMPMMANAADTLEDEVATIRQPTNHVEIGVIGVSESDAKFGEYNGLDNSGAVIGNFSLRGGDAYQGGDGTLRWGVSGSDLGTTSRELGGTVGNQGKWNLNFGYDELRHNITDTYQTPQQGSMGGNTFTLPADFGTFNAAVAPSARTLNATQLGAFHTEDVGTTRKNTSFGAGIHLDKQLSLKFDFNHLEQSGAKLIGAGALGQAATTGTWRAEAVAILMNPTNYKTDNFDVSLNWAGEKGHLTGSYQASLFKNGYDRLSWQNPMLNNATSTATAGYFQTGTLSTAPDNELHQFNLSGGYALSPTTKLAGGLSYGRNTQNTGFLTGMPEIVLSPAASLNGKVITSHADLKVTNQTTRDLSLSAGLKYNERDNQTPSSQYQYYAINSMANTNAAQNFGTDVAANAPYSNKKTDVELAGDYRLSKNQSLRLAYNHEEIDRWCNNYAIAGANCLVDTSNTEDRLGAKYKVKVGDNLTLNAGYAFGKRDGKYEHNAVTPLAGLDSAAPDDVNGQNYPGYFAVPYAARKQELIKAGAHWQATDRLEFGLEGRYAKDKYSDSVLGVQDGHTSGVNLDATLSYSETSSVSAYVSWQEAERAMRIGGTGAGALNTAASYALLVAPTNIWSNQLNEDGYTVGVNTRHNLMGGKLEITGDLSYSIDKSTYGTQVPYLATCGASATLTCGTLPDIKSELLTLKIAGIYSLSKHSKVSLGYIYQKLKSDDYFYNWYQYGYTGFRGMPTNQTAPNYEVNVIAASYVHSFK
jgi:MtrB/PioB family decaheme-associated outer membrane protein